MAGGIAWASGVDASASTLASEPGTGLHVGSEGWQAPLGEVPPLLHAPAMLPLVPTTRRMRPTFILACSCNARARCLPLQSRYIQPVLRAP
jgi:hypothetical protein